MSILQWLAVLLIALLVAAAVAVGAGQAGLLQGTPPTDLGVRGGRLKPPSDTENSVTSQATLYPDHPQRAYADIAPLALLGDGPATIAKIRAEVEQMKGAKVIKADSDYLYAQFTTPLMKFVDDVEFWVDPAARVVQVRSASRVGKGDLGANRKRIEAVRSALASAP